VTELNVIGPRQAHAQFAEKSRTVTLANYDIAMLFIHDVLAGYNVNEIPKNSW
jgi:hypothetical protein